MMCPERGEKTAVTDSRVWPNIEEPHVFRRRKCKGCGLSMQTQEIIVIVGKQKYNHRHKAGVRNGTND